MQLQVGNRSYIRVIRVRIGLQTYSVGPNLISTTKKKQFQLIVGDMLQATDIHSLNMAWLVIQMCGGEFTGLQIAASYSTAGPQQNVQRQYKTGSIIIQNKIFCL